MLENNGISNECGLPRSYDVTTNGSSFNIKEPSREMYDRFQNNKQFPISQKIIINKRLYFAIDKFPQFNFVRRLVGFRGENHRRLEQITGCKILIGGRGVEHYLQQENLNIYLIDTQSFEDSLHINIISNDESSVIHQKMDHAIHVLQPYLVPDENFIDSNCIDNRPPFKRHLVY